jgi:hypothetical protein
LIVSCFCVQQWRTIILLRVQHGRTSMSFRAQRSIDQFPGPSFKMKTIYPLIATPNKSFLSDFS